MEISRGIRMCLLIYGDMIEFVLVAVLHLYGDKLGPEMVIDFYPTEQECIEQAANAQFIVDEIADQDLDEFLNVMLDFTRKTGCRFQYRVGKSGKLPLFPCPPKETKKLQN